MVRKLKNISIKGRHGRPIILDIFFRDDIHAAGLIIFSHGFKGFKDCGAWNLLAEKFAEENFAFLKFNFSYNGTTAEYPEEFADLDAFGRNNLLIEMDDLGSVIDFSQSTEFGKLCQFPKGNVDLTLMGHSRGGGITILKGVSEPKVKRIITLASVNRFGVYFNKEEVEKWQREGVRYEVNRRTGQKLPMYYQYWQSTIDNLHLLDIPSAVKKLSKPMLIIHGTSDESIPYQAAQELHSWARGFTHLLPVENGNHTFGAVHPWKETNLPADLNTVFKACLEFLRRT